MKRVFVIIYILIFCTLSSQEMPIINEVMPNLVGSSTGRRWLEIYNPSDYPYSLQGWKIQTAGQTFTTVFTFPDIIIQPDQYIIIGENQVTFADYNANLNLQLGQNNTVGAKLISADEKYIDTVLWSSPNTYNHADDISNPAVEFLPRPPAGVSLARNPNGYDSNSISDWSLAENPTPGIANFQYYDLSISDIYVSSTGNSQFIHIVIHDLSTEIVDKNQIDLLVILNDITVFNSVPNVTFVNKIAVFDLDVTFNNSSLNYILAEISYPHDVDLSNNTMNYNFFQGFKPIIINELQFQPLTTEPEWIEFFNRSSEIFRIENGYIKNAAGRMSIFSANIEPFDYFIITQNIELFSEVHPDINLNKVVQPNSWAALVNTRDTIELYLTENTKIDSLSYTGVTSMRGRSLERLNPWVDNSVEWNYSISPVGSSPLSRNSITPNETSVEIVSASIIATDFLQHEIFLQNIGLTEIIEAELQIHYRKERDLEYNIINSLVIEIKDEIIVNINTIFPEDTGYHYYLYKIIYENGLNTYNKSFLNNLPPVVINEIMFQPYTNEPIWVEFIKLREQLPEKGLKFFARSDSIHIPYFDGEFALLTTNASNALIMRDLFDIPNNVPIFTGLRTLLNAGQDLALLDYDDNNYEKFAYTPSFSVRRGVSAERISPNLPADAQNFSGSLNGATPGKTNSVYMNLIPETSSFSINNNPFSPYKGEHCIIRISIKEQLVRADVKIFDIKGREIIKLADKTNIPGEYSFIWNGFDSEGRIVSPGVYPIYVNIENVSGHRLYESRKLIYIGK